MSTTDTETRKAGRLGSILRLRAVPPKLRVAIFVVIGIALLSVAIDLGTASPSLCFSCHEMELRAESWDQSGHSVVKCVKCHQPPTEWYELPTRLVDRAALLGRDVRAHLSGQFADPVDAPSISAVPVGDEVCLQCHDPNRKATSGYRILIDHVEHAKRNGSCVSCHVRTAHPQETRGDALSLMGQCYTCHGTADYPKAPVECGACHPAGFDLVPAAHTEARWARSHGDTSEADADLCDMCHEQTFCDDCHGLAMPHPGDWAAGTEGHAVAAEVDRTVCEACHGSGPDMCTMCHHTSYDPTEGAWVDQHADEVESEGAEYCETCHAGAYCSFCHTSLVIDD